MTKQKKGVAVRRRLNEHCFENQTENYSYKSIQEKSTKRYRSEMNFVERFSLWNSDIVSGFVALFEEGSVRTLPQRK